MPDDTFGVSPDDRIPDILWAQMMPVLAEAL
jgi:hypothetical protein